MMDDDQNPALTEILPGFACNLKCRFCSIPLSHRAGNKSTEKVKEEIKKTKEAGSEIIGFSGGEPTIRNDIIDLVRFAKKQGFRTVRIQTNGVLFSDLEFTEKIIKAGANYFKFSIHAHRAEIHDYLTQVQGSFAKTVQGLKNIRKHNRTVEVNFVINKYNYRFLPQTTKFLLDLGTSKFVFIYPSYIGVAGDNIDNIFVPASEVILYAQDALDVTDDYGLDKAITFSLPLCMLDKEYRKYASGELSDPKTVVRGPDFEVNLNQKFHDEKVKAEQCKRCKYFKLCDGIREEYADYYGLDEIEPIEGEKVESKKNVQGI